MNKLMKSDPQRVLSCSLRPKDLFHCVARHGVEEQAHKSHQESNDQELDQAHFVIIPQKVLQGLEWVHEPRER